MRNIKLIIEYDGSGFNGWQAQVQGKRLRTIQEEIEKAGKRLFGKKISLTGSSRTDAGVHAKAQVANFRIDSNLPLNKIKNGLNSFLTRRISITSAEEVSLRFHSRLDSKEKLYKYTILNRKARSPLLEKYSALVPYDMNIIAMKKAAGYLIGRKNFKSFQTGDKREKNSVRVIRKIEIISRPPVIEICVRANGFLYNMARAIVGTLIEVGRGRFNPEKVKEILEART